MLAALDATVELVSVGGERSLAVDAAVRRAAKLADAWFMNPHQRMDTIERQLEIYKTALDEFKKPLPKEMPLMREIFVARTRDEAVRLARPYLEEKYKVYHEWGQDKAMPKGDDDLSLDFDELTRDRFLFGSPDEVTEQIVGYNKRLGVTPLTAPLPGRSCRRASPPRAPR